MRFSFYLFILKPKLVFNSRGKVKNYFIYWGLRFLGSPVLKTKLSSSRKECTLLNKLP